MELLDRYLNAVRPLLPDKERDDILEELSEEIRGQMRERELDLGRSLTEKEQDEILQRYGNPLLVGGRYHPYQGTLTFGKELIGRELFPIYMKALKVTFGISIPATLAIHTGLSFAKVTSFGQLAQSLMFHLPIQFAVLTGVFAWLQAHITRHPEQWEANRVKPDGTTVDLRTKARYDAIVDFVVGACFSLGSMARSVPLPFESVRSS